MLATNVSKEYLPLVVEEITKGLLVTVADGSELNRVETELLQVAKRKVPSQVGNEEVKCDAR